ncbi:hypothetical protein B0H34DRAFT_100150 [Crassisporium funariophilum]|nr:hypothetical protein B0H34DRAFT_100150 [Crassisporium funariophilum]
MDSSRSVTDFNATQDTQRNRCNRHDEHPLSNSAEVYSFSGLALPNFWSLCFGCFRIKSNGLEYPGLNPFTLRAILDKISSWFRKVSSGFVGDIFRYIQRPGQSRHASPDRKRNPEIKTPITPIVDVKPHHEYTRPSEGTSNRHSCGICAKFMMDTAKPRVSLGV